MIKSMYKERDRSNSLFFLTLSFKKENRDKNIYVYSKGFWKLCSVS